MSHYPYETSPIGRYALKRDEVMILYNATASECWKYIHRHHCYSVWHALKYEGYQILPLQEWRKEQ